MEEKEIIKRIEKLERDSHPPVGWKKIIDNISNRVDQLTTLYGEIIHILTKQRK